MGVIIELGNGKVKYYNNVLDYLDDTEDGMQKIIADNIGGYINPKTMRLATDNGEDYDIDDFLEK